MSAEIVGGNDGREKEALEENRPANTDSPGDGALPVEGYGRQGKSAAAQHGVESTESAGRKACCAASVGDLFADFLPQRRHAFGERANLVAKPAD